MRRSVLLLLLCLLSIILVSCTPPTTVPIGTIDFREGGAKGSDTLLVFLPGIRDMAEVYGRQGLITAVGRDGIKADMIGVDAHIGYYKEKKLLGRLKADVIEPAKKQGYKRIWLVGISLGGFGALWYDVENPGDLTGIVSLSPYLGEPEMVAEVERAGGLKAWQPPTSSELDDQHRIWRGLKSYEHPERSVGRVYLGYGLDDKFAFPDSMLGAVLPAGQALAIQGGHDWSTWSKMWDKILKMQIFQRNCGE